MYWQMQMGSSNYAGSDGFCGEHCVEPGHHQAEEGGGELGQYQAGAFETLVFLAFHFSLS